MNFIKHGSFDDVSATGIYWSGDMSSVVSYWSDEHGTDTVCIDSNLISVGLTLRIIPWGKKNNCEEQKGSDCWVWFRNRDIADCWIQPWILQTPSVLWTLLWWVSDLV